MRFIYSDNVPDDWTGVLRHVDNRPAKEFLSCRGAAAKVHEFEAYSILHE